MEAIAAVDLASNILQFAEFGIKVVSNGVEFYTSVDGKPESSAAIESTISHLDTLLSSLKVDRDNGKS